jgi:8-oxo-dGTP pyrophosphatase MutT (NUDIX family)
MPDRDRLRLRLLSHQPADALESAHRDRMLALSAGPRDPFSRNRFDPGHFTASAFVLSPDEGSLLLILHAKLGLWLQPGGHIDPEDMDIVAAARREVAEETGLGDDAVETLGGLLDLDIHRIPANPKKREPAHEHFDVRVLLRARTLDLSAGSDALDARWVRLGEVQDAGTDDSVRRAVRKLSARGPKGRPKGS